MKTIKLLFAILLMSPMFIACESSSVNDEAGTELEQIGGDADTETDAGSGDDDE